MTEPVEGEQDLLIRRKRALYRAQHRGTKEMDWMLGRYADKCLRAMEAEQLTTFERLLETADPEINSWLLEPIRCPDPSFADLITEIRAFNSLS